MSRNVCVTRDEQSDAGVTFATMDHSDIRGLVTAFHLFFAELPRSKNGDHLSGCPHKNFEGSPHRSLASPCRSGVLHDDLVSSRRHLHSFRGPGYSGLFSQIDVLTDVPYKTGQFTRNGDTDFVLVELASHAQMSVALGQTQLGFPGDIANDLGLPLLTYLQVSANARLVSVIPGC